MIGALLFVLLSYFPEVLLLWLIFKILSAKTDKEDSIKEQKEKNDDSGWLFYLK